MEREAPGRGGYDTAALDAYEPGSYNHYWAFDRALKNIACVFCP